MITYSLNTGCQGRPGAKDAGATVKLVKGREIATDRADEVVKAPQPVIVAFSRK
jgi:hypothetical protein